MSTPLSGIPITRIESRCTDWPVVPTVAALVFCALLLGTAAQFLGPFRIPWVEDHSMRVEAMAFDAGVPVVDAAGAEELIAGGRHLVLDARELEEFHEGHLPGAVPFPYASRVDGYNEMAALLGPDQPVLVYCSGRECDDAFLLAVFLREQGSGEVVLFIDGVRGWKERGLSLQ